MNLFSHHKCATRWLEQYLLKLTSMNGLTFFRTDFSDEPRDPVADIAFFGNTSYEFLISQGLTGCHVIRNPLSVVVSAYYSHLKTHPTSVWPELVAHRSLLESMNRDDGLSLTLEFAMRPNITPRALGPLLAMRQWDYSDSRFTTLRMEDLVANPATTLSPIVRSHFGSMIKHLPTDAEFMFGRFANGRRVGEVDSESHYRSGSADAWRLELPQAVLGRVRAVFGDILQQFYPAALKD